MKETLHVTGAAFRNIHVQEKGPQWLCCLQLPVLRDREPHRSSLFDWPTKPMDRERWPKEHRWLAQKMAFFLFGKRQLVPFGKRRLVPFGKEPGFGQMLAELPLGKKTHLCNLAQQVSLRLPLPFWL